MFGRHADVELGARRADEVEAEALVLSFVLECVGPGGHGLGLEGLEGPELAGRKLARNDAFQIILQVDDVDKDDALRGPPRHGQEAPVAPSIERQEALRVGRDEIEDRIPAERFELVVEDHPDRPGGLFDDLLAVDPDVLHAGGVDLGDLGQSVAAGQEIAELDLEDAGRVRLAVFGDVDLAVELDLEGGRQLVGLFTLLGVGQEDDVFLGELLAAPLDLDLVGVISDQIVIGLDLIDLHARGGADADVLEVGAQADADDGLGDHEAVKERPLGSEFDRGPPEEKERDEQDKQVLYLTKLHREPAD